MNGNTMTEEFGDLRVPEIPPLKHQDTVMRELFSQPRSSALLIRIVALPMYVFACALMKTLYQSRLPFQSSMAQVRLSLGQPMAIVLFCLLPLIGLLTVVVSSVRIKKDPASRHSFIAVHVSRLNAVLALLALSIAVYALLLVL